MYMPCMYMSKYVNLTQKHSCFNLQGGTCDRFGMFIIVQILHDDHCSKKNTSALYIQYIYILVNNSIQAMISVQVFCVYEVGVFFVHVDLQKKKWSIHKYVYINISNAFCLGISHFPFGTHQRNLFLIFFAIRVEITTALHAILRLGSI